MHSVLRLYACQQATRDAVRRKHPDLIRRIWEHKTKAIPGFTAKYDVDRLVWFEAHQSIAAAATRERQIKEWKRAWKIELIERDNPQWIDLYPSLSL